MAARLGKFFFAEAGFVLSGASPATAAGKAATSLGEV